MLQIENFCKAFKSGPALQNASFTVETGSLVGLVGPSGSGKSVLLKLLGGVMEADQGTVRFDSLPIGSSPEIGFLFQEGALFDSMTVLENVAFPLMRGFHGFDAKRTRNASEYDEAVERAYKKLCEVGLRDAYKKYPGQLSGGMRRRVALARAVVHKPHMVLLDDPTAGLDPVAASVIMNLIKNLHREYRPTVIMVSQDIRRLLPNVDQVIALFDGRVEGSFAPRDARAQANDKVLRFLKTRFDFSVFDGQRTPELH